MLLGYWRFEEGSGTVISDVTDHKADIKIADGEGVWLEEVPTDVLDTEDMWGKNAQPAYAFDLSAADNKRIQIDKHHVTLGSFTFEFWMMSSASSFTLDILGSIDLGYADGKIKLQVDKSSK